MEEDLKNFDRPRYICSLFVEPEKRQKLQALLAFNLEIAKVKESVSEQITSSIRFLWWKEALDEIYAGKNARRHPVLLEISTIYKSLSKAHFETIIEARSDEFDNGIKNFEEYASKTGGVLNLLCAEALEIKDEDLKKAAFEIGKKYALAGLGKLEESADSRIISFSEVESREFVYFKKQKAIADYWSKNPAAAKLSRIPLFLAFRLML